MLWSVRDISILTGWIGTPMASCPQICFNSRAPVIWPLTYWSIGKKLIIKATQIVSLVVCVLPKVGTSALLVTSRIDHRSEAGPVANRSVEHRRILHSLRMESIHVAANAVQIFAPEVAQFALEIGLGGFVQVAHVSLDIGFVTASVNAIIALVDFGPRSLFARALHVTLE